MQIGNVEEHTEELSDNNAEYEDAGDYRAAAGWMIFVAIMGMIIETVIIVIRILNISFINQNFTIFGITVSHFFIIINVLHIMASIFNTFSSMVNTISIMKVEVAVCKPEVRVGRSWDIASMCLLSINILVVRTLYT